MYQQLTKSHEHAHTIDASENFIKSENNDSFVNHFDGHFAYLKIFVFNTAHEAQCQKKNNLMLVNYFH